MNPLRHALQACGTSIAADVGYYFSEVRPGQLDLGITEASTVRWHQSESIGSADVRVGVGRVMSFCYVMSARVLERRVHRLASVPCNRGRTHAMADGSRALQCALAGRLAAAGALMVHAALRTVPTDDPADGAASLAWVPDISGFRNDGARPRR